MTFLVFSCRPHTRVGVSDKQKYKKLPLGGKPGQWSARKAQLSVLYYKRRGGGYKGGQSRKHNALAKWTREQWGYIGKDKRSRYLPKKAGEALRYGVHRTFGAHVLRFTHMVHLSVPFRHLACQRNFHLSHLVSPLSTRKAPNVS